MPGATPELKNKLVRAGAGAGKTTGLVKQVLAVYETYTSSAGRAPRIVVTTFTRKATQELKERLIRKACDDRNAGFLRFVSDPARLHISTIHGLLSVFLKQVGHLADLDSGFKILSESEGWTLARKALRNVMIKEAAHLAWFERFDFSRLVSMCRNYSQLEQEFGPLRPADLTDIQNGAALIMESWREQLNEHAAAILEEVDEEKWQTFALELKSFAGTWPDTPASDRPKKPARRGAAQNALIHWHERIELFFKDFDKAFDRVAWQPERWPELAELWREFHDLARAFHEDLTGLKKQTGSYEMSDLELLTVKILNEKPFLADVFGGNWDYWMIDEYQDTSPIQARCLKALIGDKPKYLVGDPQQSIYLFRGADVGVFLAAEGELAAGKGEVTELLTNYRSAPELLNMINAFMASVDGSFKAMSPAPDRVGNLQRVCGRLIRASDPEQEMQALVARVGELVQAGAPLQGICILGRTHAHLKDAAAALRAHGFPTHLHATTGFNTRREVMDARALWRFLINPHDNHNLVTLLRSPWFYVSDGDISNWLSIRPISLWRHLTEVSKSYEPHHAIARLREAQMSVTAIGVVKTFERFLREAGFLDLALENDPAGRKESNLWKMIAKARELESQSTRSLLELAGDELILDPLEASEGDATSAQEPNCINLMTIHGAKGLEFDHVIVPRVGKSVRAKSAEVLSAENGKFFFPTIDEDTHKNEPSILDLARLERQRADESREFNRALYVAATRAKSTLTFTWSTVEKNSWVERSPWFQWPEGEHQGEGFKVQVAESWPAPIAYSGSRSMHGAAVRTPYQRVIERQVKRQSVTGLVGGDQKGRPSAAHEETLRGIEARSTGQKIHRLLESLKYRGEESEDLDPAAKFVLSLKNPPIRELIRDGFVEWGFQVNTPRGVIEGQVDLWGEFDGRIYVIDYKSGSPSRIQQAFEQLSLYGWALRRFGHKQPVTLAVIYPLSEKVELKEFSGELFARWENEFRLP